MHNVHIPRSVERRSIANRFKCDSTSTWNPKQNCDNFAIRRWFKVLVRDADAVFETATAVSSSLHVNSQIYRICCTVKLLPNIISNVLTSLPTTPKRSHDKLPFVTFIFYFFRFFSLFLFCYHFKLHLPSVFVYYIRRIGQKMPHDREHKLDESQFWKEFLQKDSVTDFEPQICGVTFCGPKKILFTRPEDLTKKKSQPCTFIRLFIVFSIRVVNNASLKCIARWYYLFTMFLFICGHCVSYIHVFIMITNKQAK